MSIFNTPSEIEKKYLREAESSMIEELTKIKESYAHEIKSMKEDIYLSKRMPSNLKRDFDNMIEQKTKNERDNYQKEMQRVYKIYSDKKEHIRSQIEKRTGKEANLFGGSYIAIPQSLLNPVRPL